MNNIHTKVSKRLVHSKIDGTFEMSVTRKTLHIHKKLIRFNEAILIVGHIENEYDFKGSKVTCYKNKVIELIRK